MEATNSLPGVVYVNAATELGEKVLAAAETGAMVANAPRPLPGAITWRGEWHHGTFYACGVAAELGLGELWARDDAYEVVALSDAEIEQRFAAEYARMGYDYREVKGRYELGGMDPMLHMARSFDLPHSALWDPAARGRRR